MEYVMLLFWWHRAFPGIFHVMISNGMVLIDLVKGL